MLQKNVTLSHRFIIFPSSSFVSINKFIFFWLQRCSESAMNRFMSLSDNYCGELIDEAR